MLPWWVSILGFLFSSTEIVTLHLLSSLPSFSEFQKYICVHSAAGPIIAMERIDGGGRDDRVIPTTSRRKLSLSSFFCLACFIFSRLGSA